MRVEALEGRREKWKKTRALPQKSVIKMKRLKNSKRSGT